MPNPYRHRDVSASDILNMSISDCINIEKSIDNDLSNFER